VQSLQEVSASPQMAMADKNIFLMLLNFNLITGPGFF